MSHSLNFYGTRQQLGAAHDKNDYCFFIIVHPCVSVVYTDKQVERKKERKKQVMNKKELMRENK